MHYKRWQRTGHPEGVTPERRFFAQVQQDPFGCWNWAGRRTKAGYGRFHDDHKDLLAHRWVYEFLRADIPVGLELDHLCRNRACVNPWHLEPVTRSVNALRTYQTCPTPDCPSGNEYAGSPEINPRGLRLCGVCLARARVRATDQPEEASR